MAALTRRDVSRAELIGRLIEREVDPEDAEAEADRLERVGLIDDAAFAERLVERLRRRKGIAGAALRAELRSRKLADEAIEHALDAVDRDDDRAFAIELAQKRARSLGRLERDVAERRLAAFLMRKGYSGSIVREAVSAVLGRGRDASRSHGGVRFRSEE
ncbi:regulatory protein RecX [Ruicaihuangia caeni]|uniref:regulatory protein RecX n=1 Tax=Ruicaihuangia caeni TaxID=3042517 RepID=UPI00338F00D8